MIKNVIVIGCLMIGIGVKAQVGIGTLSPLSIMVCREGGGGQNVEYNVKEENKINLQEYVEQMYQLSSKWSNKGALLTIEKGKFKVLVKDKNVKGEDVYHLVLSENLRGYTQDDIEKLEYRSGSDKYDDMGYVGVVILVFKEGVNINKYLYYDKESNCWFVFVDGNKCKCPRANSETPSSRSKYIKTTNRSSV